MKSAQLKVGAWVCAGVGVVFLAVGLVLGLAPISAGGVSCGSALKPSNDAAQVQDLETAMSADATGGAYVPSQFAANCQDATASRKTVAWALLTPGIIGGVGAFGFLIGWSNVRDTERAAAAEVA